MPEHKLERYPISVLELVLAAWEDHWFLLELINENCVMRGRPRLCSPDGALANWQRFRRFLLNLHKTEVDPLACKSRVEFHPPEDLPEMMEREFLHNQFPLWLACWMSHSRRVYCVSEELQFVLRATSLRDVRWTDVRYPFPAFALSLSQPIPHHGREFDFVAVLHGTVEQVQNGDKENEVCILAFSRKCYEYSPLTVQQKQSLQAAARNKKRDTWFKINSMRLYVAASCALEGSAGYILPVDILNECTVLETAGLDHEQIDHPQPGDKEMFDYLSRLVVGFSLYLQSLPPGSRHLSDPSRLPTRSGLPDRRAITSEAEVCTVASIYNLTPKERAVLGAEGEMQQRAQYELGCERSTSTI